MSFPPARYSWLSCLLLLWFAAPVAAADEEGAQADPITAAPESADDAASPDDAEDSLTVAERVAALIRKLNDDRFAERQAASRELEKLGGKTIDALKRAAQGPHLEVTTRTIDLLEKMAQQGQPAEQAKAREALEELAALEHGAAAAAAKRVLAKQGEVAEQPINIFGGGGFGRIQVGQGGQIQIGGQRIRIGGGPGQARIQLQVQAIGGQNNVKIKMQNVNGAKTIDAEEGGRKVHIDEDAGGKISMEITTEIGDKKETKKYQANNAAELQKNHPEAYKLYRKYTAGQRLPFQINGLPAAEAEGDNERAADEAEENGESEDADADDVE